MEQNDILDSVVMTKTPVKDLEGAGGILAMGIISIPFCLGIILASITLTKSGKQLALYKQYPHEYTESSYSKIKTGRACAIVSLCLLGLGILLIILANGLG